MIQENIYLDLKKIISYGSLLNFIIAERGVGKTFGAKSYIIDHFKSKHKQSVYVRRYNRELQESLMKKGTPIFFDQIKKKYPNDKLSNNSEVFYCNGEICGFAVPLSTSNILKSVSFEDVDTIIFDEYIIDNTGVYHYIKNEVTLFMELLETIIRLKPNIKVLLLGNAISITNPYFIELNLSLPYNSEFKIFKRDDKGQPLILVYYGKNLKYREEKKKTRFGQLIEGTSYGKYAIDNEMLRDSKSFIQKKTANSKFYFILKLNNKNIGIWLDYQEQKMFISYDYDPLCPVIFSMTNEDHDEHTLLLRCRTSPFFKSIIEYYRTARLCFENQQIKNQIMNILIKYLTY